jgi:hypothetical protein
LGVARTANNYVRQLEIPPRPTQYRSNCFFVLYYGGVFERPWQIIQKSDSLILEQKINDCTKAVSPRAEQPAALLGQAFSPMTWNVCLDARA